MEDKKILTDKEVLELDSNIQELSDEEKEKIIKGDVLK